MNTDKHLRPIIQAKYAEFVALHGEVFEQYHEPFTAEDKKHLGKSMRVFVFGFAPAAVILFSLTLAYIWDDSITSWFLLGFILLMIAICIFVYYNFQNALKKNKKVIVKGVLTGKERKTDTSTTEFIFTISDRISIHVDKKQYEKFTFGEIIEIQVLSQSTLSLKNKIRLLGKIKMN